MNLKYLIFPRRCSLCFGFAYPWEEVCRECRKNDLSIHGEVCTLCGLSKEDCTCGGKKHFYDKITAAYVYDGGVRSGIHYFKFRGKRNMSVNIARTLYQVYKEREQSFDYDFICYVPQTSDEVKKRGFYHTRLIARILAVYAEIPCLDILAKLYDTKSQRMFKAHQRHGNVFGVFDTVEFSDVEDKRILLVDDIRTTGATLDECAKMLKIRGAEIVDVLVYAAARERKHKAEYTSAPKEDEPSPEDINPE